MFGKCVRSFIEEMGIVAIMFIVFSLIFPKNIEVRHLYQMVCIAVPVHLFSFLTFELRLFSSRIWIRRAIVIFFSLLVLLVNGYISGSLHFNFDSLLIHGIAAGIGIIITVFCYYISDKIEQQNLKLINQKLSDERAKNME